MHIATRPALVLTTALALGLALPQPAAAHGDTLDVVISGHRDGHVLTQVTWENDGDAVDGQVAGLVSAVSADGRRTAGPWRLVRGARPADWTTLEALPAGVWQITVDAGQPALGHAERELTVAAAPAAPATASAPGGTAATPAGAPQTSPTPAAARAPAASPSAPADRSPGLTVVGFVAASLVGAAAGVWIRRRRGRRR
ncbi:hypothetical protein ACGF1Z_00750 [Streptomyces sp. NPDC048018]|uniref:hypothetical protein n=1 Tax=Streptomyces sp. NPDC048018 TaxID=3365499 RepID=UPI003711FCD4